jgi:hypothetical protein
MKEYLTTNELSQQIKMAPGTIRNLVYKGIFVNGVHYIKPTPRKLLFIGSAIEAWLYGKPTDNSVQGNSLINI